MIYDHGKAIGNRNKDYKLKVNRHQSGTLDKTETDILYDLMAKEDGLN